MRVIILLGLVLTLAACGSRLNPLNWFGGPQEERITVVEPDVPVDPRGLVAEVTDLDVAALPSGALITATGLPPRQGFWAASLVEVSREDGVITYEFRIAEPPGATEAGSARAREVITAADLSNQDLAGIRQIVVVGASNRLSVRR